LMTMNLREPHKTRKKVLGRKSDAQSIESSRLYHCSERVTKRK
jgi:hypothetical protein